jgi:alginate O-acetyltransferase complex protein AlgI
MLFNSYEFVFAFLPLSLLGFFVLGRWSRTWALGWLIVASVFFYAWWRPLNVLLIAPSIVINYVLARTLQNLAGNEERRGLARLVLIAGMVFNVAFLGYFKYRNFFLGAANDVFGTHFVLTHLILPLAISFITFQKIAFLIDVHAGRVQSFTLRDYCLFVLFFPQLIAGPIVHYREMMPQFHAASCRFNAANVSVGLTLFFFGLFKKVFLADGIAPFVTPLYERAAGGEGLSLLLAWYAAMGFTLQIYFDFSGYSDMALGLARFFGIRLPPNFDSPMRASSIIDYWLRWHMTLTRFLTAYIYSPLALALTRRRMARGLPGLTGRNSTPGAFVTLLMFPTLLTMLVSGFWHGAGYLFVLWGLLHGLFLCINHAWRLLVPRFWHDKEGYRRVMTPVGFVLTFLSVAVAMVFFRAPTLQGATHILAGMIGLDGINLPAVLHEHPGPLAGVLHAMNVGVAANWSAHDFLEMEARMALLLFIALLCPNTLQLLARFEPALGIKPRPDAAPWIGRRLGWNASLAWSVAVSILAAVAIVHLGGKSEFLYWQF